MVVVGTSGTGAVDAGDAGTCKELFRQSHVPISCEISPTTFPDPEGCARRLTCHNDWSKRFQFRTKSKGKFSVQSKAEI